MRRCIVGVLSAILCAGCIAPAARPSEPALSREDATKLIVAEQTAALVAALEESGSFIQDIHADRLFHDIAARLPVPADRGKPHIRLVRNPNTNAFALYDGTIGIHTGALAKTTHPDHIAFLIAHECAHWVARHSVSSYSHASQSILVVQIVDATVTPLLARLGYDELAERGIGFIANAAVNGHTRELEAEADLASLTMLVQGGFEPRRALDIIKIFQGTDAHSPLHAGSMLLATHPSSSTRSETIVRFLQEHSLEPFPSVSFDATFVRDTAEIRLFDARLQRRAGRYFEALDDLSILQRAFTSTASHLPTQLFCEKSLVYAGMVRDFERVKESVPREYWESLYGQRTDEQIRDIWLRRATESLAESKDSPECASAAQRAVEKLPRYTSSPATPGAAPTNSTPSPLGIGLASTL